MQVEGQAIKLVFTTLKHVVNRGGAVDHVFRTSRPPIASPGVLGKREDHWPHANLEERGSLTLNQALLTKLTTLKR
jgi:hypothetical protein